LLGERIRLQVGGFPVSSYYERHCWDDSDLERRQERESRTAKHDADSSDILLLASLRGSQMDRRLKTYRTIKREISRSSRWTLRMFERATFIEVRCGGIDTTIPRTTAQLQERQK
jgi:hypothetical protein